MASQKNILKDFLRAAPENQKINEFPKLINN
jgi:hypothetical protein